MYTELIKKMVVILKVWTIGLDSVQLEQATYLIKYPLRCIWKTWLS